MNHKHKLASVSMLLAWIASGAMAFESAVAPLQPATRPFVKPWAPLQPATRPVQPLKQTIRSEQGVLLIEDQVASSQYITTLDSHGGMIAGSPPQAIFGARTPGQGAKKTAIWYTHKADGQVKFIRAVQPKDSFRGMADDRGNPVATGEAQLRQLNAGQMNPVLSEQAFSDLAHLPAGGSSQFSMQEILAEGRERELITTVRKRGQLILGAAPAQSCRNEMVEGVQGKLCTLRTVQGQHQATTAGDIKFTVRARMPAPNARFRVGQTWHRFGESVGLAEFATSKAIEVFFVPQQDASSMARPQLKLDRLVEAGFYSASRLGRGDRFNLKIGNLASVGGSGPVLSRLSLLLVDDQPSGRQYVTTLSGSGQQAVFGERKPQGGSRSAIWYTENPLLKSLFPYISISQLTPPQYFLGVANQNGDVVQGKRMPPPGYIHPAFNDQAFADFVSLPVGQQQLLGFTGQQSNGDKTQHRLNLHKAAQLVLSAPAANSCRSEAVAGVQGQICALRQVSGSSKASSGGDLRFRLSSKAPIAPQARYRVGTNWHPIGEEIGIAEFAQSRAIELFMPAMKAAPPGIKTSAMQGEFYSLARRQNRDLFGFDLSKKRPQQKEIYEGDLRISSFNSFSVSGMSFDFSLSFIEADSAMAEGNYLEGSVMYDRDALQGESPINFFKIGAPKNGGEVAGNVYYFDDAVVEEGSWSGLMATMSTNWDASDISNPNTVGQNSFKSDLINTDRHFQSKKIKYFYRLLVYSDFMGGAQPFKYYPANYQTNPLYFLPDQAISQDMAVAV